MKALVIYYSLEGNTKLVAETIAAQIGADCLALQPEKAIKTTGFMKYFWGGRQVVMKERPALLPFDKDLAAYSLIIIGTPVWAATYAPAINTLFSAADFSNKKVAVFACHEGGPGKVLDNMKSRLTGSQILGANSFFAPLKKDRDQTLQQAKEWAETINSKS